MSNVPELLEKIVEILRTQYGDPPTGLNAPIDLDTESRLRDALECPLPNSLAEMLRWHNGEDRNATSFFLVEFSELFSAERIADSYAENLRLASIDQQLEYEFPDWYVSGGVRKCMWSKGWVPFWNYGMPWAIDLNPAEDGCMEQIISVDWEDRSSVVQFPSLEQMLGRYVDLLESGERDFELCLNT